MNVAGVDPSLTQTAVARPPSSVRVIKTPASKISGPHRLVFIRDSVNALVEGCDVVFIEHYSFGSKNKGEYLGELGGVIRVMLYEAGIPYVEVPPSTLKMFATGKGNAGKPEVLQAAWQRLGYQGTNDNEADALWLRALGMAAYGHPQLDLPKTHMRALVKLDLPDLTIQETT